MFWWVEGFPKELVNEPFFGTQICFRYKSSLSYFIANAIICNPFVTIAAILGSELFFRITLTPLVKISFLLGAK